MPGLLLRSSSNRAHSTSPPPSIHHRRTLSRAHTGTSTPPPLPMQGLSFPFPQEPKQQLEMNLSILAPVKGESEVEIWERMLALQREYRCYNSARVEAAVEALEMGWGIEEVGIPSRLCLNLLNEGLRAQIIASQEMRAYVE